MKKLALMMIFCSLSVGFSIFHDYFTISRKGNTIMIYIAIILFILSAGIFAFVKEKLDKCLITSELTCLIIAGLSILVELNII